MKKIIFIIVFLFTSFQAFAAEYISNFDVEAQFDKRGRATITETIIVNAEHNKIKRGIYRTIPQNSLQRIKAKKLEMDDFPHPFFTEQGRDNITINFGSDNHISPGVHVYKLTYTMDNAVLFKDEYDEIYWNVTGNYWDFPIEQASFRLILPEGAEVIKEGISLYTGQYGASDKNAQSVGDLNFRTTAPLESGSGFTVAVPFKKGLIESNFLYKSQIFITKQLPLLLLGILILYFIITWIKYGKDPKYDGRVLYAPPAGISPAFARYILERNCDEKLFASALVSLSAKKKIKIVKQDSKIELERLSQESQDLPEEEKFIIDDVFSSNQLYIGGSYQRRIEDAMTLINLIMKKQGSKFVNKNMTFAVFPAIIMLLMQIPIGYPLLISNIFGAMITFAFATMKKARVIVILYIIAFTAISLPAMLSTPGEIPFLIALLCFFFYIRIIDNTTYQGKEIYLNILGFKRYMETAEKHRTELSNPEDKAKIFADYLPYAYAFGIQSQWIKSFTKILSKEMIEQKLNDMGGRTMLINYAIASSLAKSFTPPSSSGKSSGGGSFGGGFSGGGFGGGGGGGR